MNSNDLPEGITTDHLVESPSPMRGSEGCPISPLLLTSFSNGTRESGPSEQLTPGRLQESPSCEIGSDVQIPMVEDDPVSIHSLRGSIHRRAESADQCSIHVHYADSHAGSSCERTYETTRGNGSSTNISNGDIAPVVFVTLQDTNSAWATCVKRLQKYDQSIVKGWKEDIDTLLVLTGLLSAIITGFNIEFYKLLQPDSEDAIVSLLLQISAQMANNSLPVVTKPQFSKPPYAIIINTLWFTSLVVSLTVALIGILVKQWLRDYLSGRATSPREGARIRQFRHQGLVAWYIPEIIAFLPVLLQFALTCFFLGLLDLLWNLDYIVAGVVTAFVVASLLFLIITTVIPAIYENSPHRSPQSLAIFFVGVRIARIAGSISLWTFRLLGWTYARGPLYMNEVMFKISGTRRRLVAWAINVVVSRPPRSWAELEKRYVQRHADGLDRNILVGADAIFMDDSFLEQVIRPCISGTSTTEAIECLCKIFHNRSHGYARDGAPTLKPYQLVDNGLSTLIHSVADTLNRIDGHDSAGALRVLDILHELCRVMPFESEHQDARALYQRIHSALAALLYHQSDVQRKAFDLMRKLLNRSSAPSSNVVVESILSYSRNARSKGDNETYYEACSMVLIMVRPRVSASVRLEYRDSLKKMINELEEHLNMSQNPDVLLPPPPPSLFVGLVDIAQTDGNLVGTRVIEILTAIMPGGDRRDPASRRTLERALELRNVYGGLRPKPKRRGALNLRLPPGGDEQSTPVYPPRVITP